MRAGDTHTLSDSDILMINQMADVICSQKRDFFVSNVKRDNKLSFREMNVNGFGAELSFCRLANIEFDQSTDERDNHFKRADCVLSDGRTVDVKHTVYKTGRIMVTASKSQVKVDIYALMVGTFPVFKFAGWIKYEDLVKDENVQDWGYGKTYMAGQDKLSSAPIEAI